MGVDRRLLRAPRVRLPAHKVAQDAEAVLGFGEGQQECVARHRSTPRNLRAAGYDPDRIIETLLELNVRSYIAGTEQVIIPLDVLTCEKVRYLRYRNRALEEQADLANWSGELEPWRESVARRIPQMLPKVTRVTIAADYRRRLEVS